MGTLLKSQKMIAIISDSHDNLANLEEFLKQAKKYKVGTIVHCGDVTTPECLEWLVENFNGVIKVVWGNMEIRPEEFKNIEGKHHRLEIFDEIGLWETKSKIGKLKIAFSHKPEKAERLAETGRYSYVFYGHTHKPWLSTTEEGVILANPGTIGGVFSEPTYALLDSTTGKLELKKLFA